MRRASCKAPVNIAVVKYWGKRDKKLNLPINDSLSVTLSHEDLCSKTSVCVSSLFTADKIWLNGIEESIDNPRIQNCLREIRALYKAQHQGDCEDISEWKVHICSTNNFPTAAGLASSASGYACLVYTMAKAFNIRGDITHIARQGSGSACRSIYGGYVQWLKGSSSDGSDSIASQVYPVSYWPEMCCLICVVSDTKKKVASTVGMQRSVATSDLLTFRAEKLVPRAMLEISDGIKRRDFASFGKVTMQESNQFHACALDTYPPIYYMNDTSRRICDMVHAYNEHYGEIKVAYTFDAGPNACLFLLEDFVPEVFSLIKSVFPPQAGDEEKYLMGRQVKQCESKVGGLGLDVSPSALKYVISTRVGDGPVELSDTEGLLDEQGLPI